MAPSTDRRRVFISCWYPEFSRERKLIGRAIEGLGFEVSQIGSFGGLMDDVTREYLKYIHQCDLFIGIYGSAYGERVPTTDPSVLLDISWLELEYRTAEDLQKPVVGFVQKVRYREERLTELIQRIATRQSACNFNGETDLIKGVTNQLKNFDKLTKPIISSRPEPPRLKAFLCHSSGDKVSVRNIYYRLRAEGVAPWLDEENLLPGQDWQQEIKRAVRSSDVVIVCLSKASINKRGYVQKEIKIAFDVADEQPDGAIFLIPLKLEECDIPDRLRRWQWVNIFEERGFERLMNALQQRANSLGAKVGV